MAGLPTEPVLSWYAEQVKLVALIAADDNGSTLKKRQYQQAEYARTKLGLDIAPIHAVLRERLEALKAGGSAVSAAAEGGS